MAYGRSSYKAKKRRFTRHKGRKGSKHTSKHMKGGKQRYALGKVPKRNSKQAEKYLRARTDAKLIEKEGIMMPIKKQPGMMMMDTSADNPISYRDSNVVRLYLTRSTAPPGAAVPSPRITFSHNWTASELFKTMYFSDIMYDILVDKVATTGLPNKHTDFNTRTDAQKRAIADMLVDTMPYDQVRLRKVRFWLFSPELGTANIRGTWFPGTDSTNNPVSLTINMHKWKWIGLEMAPPLEADYGNWNDIQRYAFNRNRRGADGTEANIHATNWFQIAGSLLNPARAGTAQAPDTNQAVQSYYPCNAVYQFMWEYKNLNQLSNIGQISFPAAQVTENGTFETFSTRAISSSEIQQTNFELNNELMQAMANHGKAVSNEDTGSILPPAKRVKLDTLAHAIQDTVMHPNPLYEDPVDEDELAVQIENEFIDPAIRERYMFRLMEMQDENKFMRRRLNYQETEVNSCEGRIMHLEDELMKMNQYLSRGQEDSQDSNANEIDYPEDESDHDTESCATDDMDTEQINTHDDCKCVLSLKSIRARRLKRQNALSEDDIMEAVESRNVPDSVCEGCDYFRWECQCEVKVSD